MISPSRNENHDQQQNKDEQPACLSFTVSIQSLKKRNFNHVSKNDDSVGGSISDGGSDRDEDSPSPKKVKPSSPLTTQSDHENKNGTNSNTITLSATEGDDVENNNHQVSKENRPTIIKGMKKRDKNKPNEKKVLDVPTTTTTNSSSKQPSSSPSSVREETILQMIEVKIPEHEFKRTIQKCVSESIRPHSENFTKETTGSLKLISIPLWVLAFLLVILIGIEVCTKFNNVGPTLNTINRHNDDSQSNLTPITPNNVHQKIFVQENTAAIVQNNETPGSRLDSQVGDLPAVVTISKIPEKRRIKIQYLSENVDYLNNEYLQEKFRDSYQLFESKDMELEFQQIRSVEEFSKDSPNSFFLVLVESIRFLDNEKQLLKEKYLNHVDSNRSAVILICKRGILKFHDDVLGTDVFSVQWNEKPKSETDEDRTTLEGLVKKITEPKKAPKKE